MADEKDGIRLPDLELTDEDEAWANDHRHENWSAEYHCAHRLLKAALSALEEAKREISRLEQLVCDFQASGMIDVGGMKGPCEVKPIHIENHVTELREQIARLLLNQEKALRFIDILLQATEVVSSHAVLVDMKAILQPSKDF